MATDVCPTNGVISEAGPRSQEEEAVMASSGTDADKNNHNAATIEDDDDEVQILDSPSQVSAEEPLPKKAKLAETEAEKLPEHVAPPETPSRTNSSEPKRTKPEFEFGPYVPIVRVNDKIMIDTRGVIEAYRDFSRRAISHRLVGEILPDDSIVEAPSLVTPLLLKKKTHWPSKPEPTGLTAQTDNSDKKDDDDIQVVKVIGRSDTPDIVIDNNSRLRKPEEYIKAAAVSSLTNNSKTKKSTDPVRSILAIDDYIKSSAGELLFGIGLSRVMEFTLEERARKLGNKVRKGEDDLALELANTKMELVHAKQCNSRYKPTKIFQCHLCPFKSEFSAVLEQHLETPHKHTAKYLQCNWCEFKTKDTAQILYHNYVVHRKRRCSIDKPLMTHCCRYCAFETNRKRKFTTHFTMCEQMFDKDFHLAPEEPEDYPAVTPKPITQHDIRVYESTMKALKLASYNPHQIKVQSPALGPNGHPILLVPKSSTGNGQLLTKPPQQLQQRSITITEASGPYNDPTSLLGRGSAGTDRSLTAAINQPTASPNLLRLLVANSSSNNLPNNRAVILQHPRPQSPFVNGMAIVRNTSGVVMAPPPPSQIAKSKRLAPVSTIAESDATNPTGSSDNTSETPSPKPKSNPSGTFVICEICDAYIESITAFKSHMQWVHKVKIHLKVLESHRPPLNCQKCNWRYFTDQGLERHLLGSHGLVTSNMQDLADNDKDSGRCTICGVRCPRKLVSHMRDAHKINLKPAQLSYKCTVCSAVFSLYRHFENHVYRVHGDTVRKAAQAKNGLSRDGDGCQAPVCDKPPPDSHDSQQTNSTEEIQQQS